MTDNTNDRVSTDRVWKYKIEGSTCVNIEDCEDIDPGVEPTETSPSGNTT